eukprot:scaffold1207_cov76-Amphora_coffeaeformis.AAC.1
MGMDEIEESSSIAAATTTKPSQLRTDEEQKTTTDPSSEVANDVGPLAVSFKTSLEKDGDPMEIDATIEAAATVPITGQMGSVKLPAA